MALTVYGRHTSYNVQKVLWLLDDLNLEYEHIEFGSHPDDTESDDFGQLNPMRKVPVLIDDRKAIWESNTILRYIARSYGSSQWQPDNAYQNSLIERWMDWAQTRFEPAFVGVFWGYYRTPANKRDMGAINKSLDDCLFCLDRLEEQLTKGNYLITNHLSLADISTGVFIYRLVNIDLNIILPAQVQNWYAKLQQQAGFQRWAMSDFSSLKGRLQY